ncbi:MAG: FHIPEP family type III secretion protein [Candidatus Sericytochromatia bacterium]
MLTPTLTPEMLYTSEEVAEFLRVSLRTVQRLLQSGALLSFKIHGQYRIKGLDVLAYLDGVRRQDPALPQPTRPADVLASLDVPPLSLLLAPDWLPVLGVEPIAQAAPETGSEPVSALLAGLQALRQRVSLDLGFVLPGVQVRDQETLPAGAYAVQVQGQTVARGELNPQAFYQRVDASEHGKPLERLAQFAWPCEADAPDAQPASAILLAHVEGLVRLFAAEILSREDVWVMLERLRQRQSVVVEEVLSLEGPQPGKLTIGQLTRVLRELLAEGVSIRHLAQICECLADALDLGLTGDVLVEKVREGLARQLCADLADSQGVIRVLRLTASAEAALREALSGAESVLQTRVRQLQEGLLQHVTLSQTLLCSPDLRRPLRQLLARHYGAWRLLSSREVDRLYWLEAVAELDLPAV